MITRLIGCALMLTLLASSLPLFAQEMPVEFAAPKVALTGVAYDVVLRPAGGGESMPYRLTARGGRELSSGELTPGEHTSLEDLEIRPGDMPLNLSVGGAGNTIDGPVLPCSALLV